MAKVHYEWLKIKGRQGLDEARDSRRRMIYYGDDIKKDGQLAKNCCIPFGWFAPQKNADADIRGFGFRITDWMQHANFLFEKNRSSFLEGKSFREITSQLYQ